MKHDPHKHHRRSIRLKGFDYSQGGGYFVTICSHDKEELFGRIIGGEMRLNAIGEIVNAEWQRTSAMRPSVELDAHVVMPNHVHGIILLYGEEMQTLRRGTPPRAGQRDESLRRGDPPWAEQFAPTFRSPSKTVGSIVRGFKAAATVRINQMRGTPGAHVWQRNYYEHVIRGNSLYSPSYR